MGTVFKQLGRMGKPRRCRILDTIKAMKQYQILSIVYFEGAGAFTIGSR